MAASRGVAERSFLCHPAVERMESSTDRVVLTRDEATSVLRALAAFSTLLLGEVIDDSRVRFSHFGLDGEPGAAARLSEHLGQLIQAIRRDLDGPHE